MSTSKTLPWLRLYHEIIDDDKVLSLAFEDRWHYVALMCCKSKGILDREQNEEQLRRAVRIKLGVDSRTLDEIERRLVEVDLIERSTLQPVAWNKRQFISDQDPTAAERKRRERERKAAGEKAAGPNKHAYTEEFEDAWALYPSRPGANKFESFKAWNARLNHKDPERRFTPQEMTDGVRRYAAYCRAMKTEARYIKQPATFFGPDEHFVQAWEVPPPAQVGGSRSAAREAWMNGTTGNNAGGHDDRPGDYIDVEARRL